ncbi:MAG: tRNA lysidine(34) synthetase TilS [Sphingobacteriales bacterium]|nr:tRNA lysidine(34) synthetase TilS [Sphingobacteriales bacterium]
MNLLQSFLEYIKQNHLFSPKDKLLLAVSGGIDSVVLAELCKQADFDFAIAHCNFQLRGEEGDRDEQFVKALAEKYNVTFFVKAFDTKLIAQQQKTSIEETARNLRYEWFHELVDSSQLTVDSNTTVNRQLSTVILTGHHADDTIETVLMNFFRGTGIKGLRGIQPKNGKVIRPLLFARRKELETFVKENQLGFVTDSTNFENEYTRNFFRNKVLPAIKEYYHAADENILSNAERFIEVEELYNQAIAQHKKKLLTHPQPLRGGEKKGNEIHIPVLKLKKSSPLHTIVYEIIKDFGFTSHQTDEVIALLDSETGKYISSSSHRIIKNRNWLMIAPLLAADAQIYVIEQWESSLQSAAGSLQLQLINAADCQLSTANSIAMLNAAEIKYPLLLRKWKTGDYFYPLGMKKKKKLSRFFIDNKLSKTEKENVWVIESNKRIVWVVGHRIDERFKVTGKTKEILKISISQTK